MTVDKTMDYLLDQNNKAISSCCEGNMSRFHKKVFYSLLIFYGFIQCFINVNFDIMSKLSNALGFALFAFFTFIVYKQSIINKKFNGLFLMIPIFIIWVFLYTWLINGVRYEIVFQGVKILTVVSFVFYIFYVKPPLQELIKTVLIVNTFVYVSIALCYVVLGRFAYASFYGGGEYFGYISNPHTLGLGLSSLCIFYIILYVFNKNKLCILYLLINSVLLFLFNVRTYMVAVAFAVMLLILLSKKISIPSKAIILVFMFITGYGLLTVMAQDSSSRLFFSNGLQDINGLSSGRMVFWKAIMDYSFERPVIQVLLGNGVSSSKFIMEEILNWSIGAHNDIIQIIAEFGLLGLMAFAVIYAMFFKKVAVHKSSNYIIPLLSTHLVSSVLNGSMYYTFSMIIFFITVYIVLQLSKYKSVSS